ncbi:MAG: hypothetical protein ACREDR_15810, partial [Blastocatellia bacterium]
AGPHLAGMPELSAPRRSPGRRCDYGMDSEEVTKRIERLILIYNAGSGVLNAGLDSLKKVLSLQSCTLCAITHGAFTEKEEWTDCAGSILVPIEYLHKDELTSPLSSLVKNNLPSVAAVSGEQRLIVLGPDEIGQCRGSVARLRLAMKEKAEQMGLEIPAL